MYTKFDQNQHQQCPKLIVMTVYVLWSTSFPDGKTKFVGGTFEAQGAGW